MMRAIAWTLTLLAAGAVLATVLALAVGQEGRAVLLLLASVSGVFAAASAWGMTDGPR